MTNTTNSGRKKLQRYLPLFFTLSLIASLGISQNRTTIGLQDDYGTFATYEWNGIRFVTAPGNSITGVSYDHPDNYYEYYALQWNLDWSLATTSTQNESITIIHLASSTIASARTANTMGAFGSVLGWTFSSIIALSLYSTTPLSPLTGPVTLIAIIMGILTVLFTIRVYFITYILMTEEGDGWIYTRQDPYGRSWVSYGAWRNLWFPL